MAPKHSKLVSLTAAALLVLVAAPACAKEDKAQKAPKSSAAASATSAEATAETPTTTTSSGTPKTVVFEVTGTGNATTIDTDPAGPNRLYDVPLPWSSTVTVPSDVTLLQVVVVGSTGTSPGCKITLDGKVVSEKPEGGDAHCIFQPN